MITLEQAKHLATLIDAYVTKTIEMSQFECTREQFVSAKSEMTKYLANLVAQ